MSDEIYQLLSTLDPTLRHPTRFAIMTLLIVSGPQTEGEIARKLNLKWGPLSTHVSRLVEEGYVEVRKYPTLRGPRTYIIPTTKGIKAYNDYLSRLEEVVSKTKKSLGGKTS